MTRASSPASNLVLSQNTRKHNNNNSLNSPKQLPHHTPLQQQTHIHNLTTCLVKEDPVAVLAHPQHHRARLSRKEP